MTTYIHSLGLTKRDLLAAKKFRDKNNSVNNNKNESENVLTVRKGWKRALEMLQDVCKKRNLSEQNALTLLTGSPSEKIVSVNNFVDRLCQLLGSDISKSEAVSLSNKLRSQQNFGHSGHILVGDLIRSLRLKEEVKCHNNAIFPDWLLKRNDFNVFQKNMCFEDGTSNISVIGAARTAHHMRSPKENKILLKWMKTYCSFLSGCLSDKMLDFCREVEFKEYEEDMTVYQQGESNDSGAFMILTGTVHIEKNGSKVWSFSANSYFGEKSLIGERNSDIRPASAITSTPTKMLCLPKHKFLRIVTGPTQFPTREGVALFLCNSCRPFRHFTFQHILETSRRITIESITGGNKTVIKQGSRLRGIYIIRSGDVQLRRAISVKSVMKSLEGNDAERTEVCANRANRLEPDVNISIASLRKGCIIGESCILGDLPKQCAQYSAITVSEKVELCFMGEDDALKYLFSIEHDNATNAFLDELKGQTETRRIDDASLIMTYNIEIRQSLMRRKLRKLKLKPIRATHSAEKSLEKRKTLFRDSYNHRLNCIEIPP